MPYSVYIPLRVTLLLALLLALPCLLLATISDSTLLPIDTLQQSDTAILQEDGSNSQNIVEQDSTAQQASMQKLAMLPSAFEGLPQKAWHWFNNLPSSTIALVCAAVPGGGQIYNKKYWKAPIVWSIGLGCTYAITRYGSLYNEYRTAYRDFMSENPLQYESWKSFVPSGGDPKDYVGNDNIRSRLKKGTTMYRRNRDFSIILSCLAYLLTLLDVYVDAEMVDYDISPNLSMWVADPRLASPIGGNIPIVGLQYSIPF